MTARAESDDTPAQSIDIVDRQDEVAVKDLDGEFLSTQHDLEHDSI